VSRGDTATRILLAAEQQFAEHGIDGASLREISRLSGGNTAAVQYYFGDRAGLVVAVIARQRRVDDIRRNVLLDEYERRDRDDLRSLAGALVIPLATHLADPEGGRAYLQVSAEYYLRTPVEELHRHSIPDTSWQRWTRLASRLVPPVAGLVPSWFPAIRFTHMELARRAALTRRDDDSRFTEQLTDMVASLLATRHDGPSSHSAARSTNARLAAHHRRNPPPP
jgi:AcrR family transcriptional regulator